MRMRSVRQARLLRGLSCVFSCAFSCVPFLASACELFSEPPGEVVTCTKSWNCGDTIVSTADDSFCTDPAEPTRQDQMDNYALQFSNDCDGVPVNCGTGFATCSAKCTAGGACDLQDAVPIKL